MSSRCAHSPRSPRGAGDGETGTPDGARLARIDV